ncbi:uncharacterized protein LTHEOB_3015 [Neofusicoccum parvum]|uniref:Uncharacterized protein LTHEOB_3015 n=1 Tax=Neofusicoccum parvum TaxID=310453 RepID=A0ACB5SPF7_9PEZI|nr:uncharacterized protein LTHEOB_3015 [Neofusicoccum parvum]
MDSVPPTPDLLSDPLLPSIARQGQARQVLTLPWMRKRVRLGTCFRSDLFHTDTPFSTTPLFTSPITGTYLPSSSPSSFRTSDTTTATTTTSHLSTSLGVSAGCPLLHASATSHYDRAALHNTAACKTSTATTLRAGTITLATPPRLTDAAILILKHGGGLPALRHRCGDYYVAALVLGASAAALASRAAATESVAERVAVVARLCALFWSNGPTEERAWGAASGAAAVAVEACSTLGEERVSEAASGVEEVERLAGRVRGVLAGVEEVPARVEGVLGALGVRAGGVVSGEVCDALCDQGLVVELVLVPVETLWEVRLGETGAGVV